MKKLSIIFDKKVRIVALLLSLTLFFDVFFYDYKSANATGGVAVAAAASTAIPVAGPFIAITLAAVGVIGAVEWCRTHPDEVESIRKDLVNALNNAGESYAEGVKTNDAAQVAGKEWIKSNIVDGNNYISKDILDTCLDVYSSHKLLDGQVFTQTVNLKVGDTVGSQVSSDLNLFIDSFPFPNTELKSKLLEKFQRISEQYPNFTPTLTMHGSERMPDYCRLDIYDKNAISNCTVKSFGKNTADDFDFVELSGYKGDFFSFVIRPEYIDSYHSYITSNHDTWFVTSPFSYYRIGDRTKVKYNLPSLFGELSRVGIETSDHVARKNPTTGAWELPWDTGANVNVQGVGESYPVSIPWENSFVWDPSKVDYPDIALPFPTDLDIPYPDIPITGIQEQIQTGEIELPEPIPNEPDIQENEQSYMLPKWIEDRFPFCIPKDLSSLASLFSSTSRQPPEWAAKLFYGDNNEFNIPINFKYKSADGSVSFDRIAYICRLIQFILFLAGLMIVTRNILRS